MNLHLNNSKCICILFVYLSQNNLYYIQNLLDQENYITCQHIQFYHIYYTICLTYITYVDITYYVIPCIT